MTRFRVVVSQDGLTASVQAAPGPAANAQELQSAIAAAGVTTGIDAQAVANAAKQLAMPTATVNAIIAHGIAPSDGRDAELLGLTASIPQAGQISATGRIDYRERQFLQPVQTDERLAEIAPATPGIPGIDVRGEQLSARSGLPFSRRIGEGLRQNGSALIATRDGVALCTDQVVDVVPLYTHKGNVDYSSGNLHTKGSLAIEGDIDDGFQVTADGDVMVLGTVHGELHAKGSILIKRGILGQLAVRAGGDLVCHHATNGTLSAARELTVEDQLTQCWVTAPNVRVVDGRATVRGGEICARDHIEVGSAGAPAGTKTMLSVAQLVDERAELVRRSVATHRESRFASRSTDQGRGSKGLRQMVRASNRETSELVRLRRRQRELLQDASIRIKKTCFVGVTLKFGLMQLSIDDDLHDVTFHYDTDSIQVKQPKVPS